MAVPPVAARVPTRRQQISNEEEAAMHPRDPYADSTRTPATAPGIFTPWDYRPDAGWAPEFDLVGYHVEATDGSVGKVHSVTKATTIPACSSA